MEVAPQGLHYIFTEKDAETIARVAALCQEIDDINEVVLRSNAAAEWLTFDDGQDLRETPVEDLHGHEYDGDLDIDLTLVVDKKEVYVKAVNRITLRTMCFTPLILHADLNKAFGLTPPETNDEPAASVRKRARL